MTTITDKQRLDFLESLFGVNIILRLSTKGRGWRLHDTTKIPGYPSVRAAIDAEMTEQGLARE